MNEMIVLNDPSFCDFEADKIKNYFRKKYNEM